MSGQPVRSWRNRGFTLVEMMTVLVIMGIGLALAAPSFTAYQRNAELTSTANALLSSMSVARGEALKTSLFTYVQPNTAGNWASGWIAYADTNGNAAYDAGTDTLLDSHGPLAGTVTVVTSASINGFADNNGDQYVSYNGSGFPRTKGAGFTGGALQFEIAEHTDTKRLIVLNLTGRSRVCNPDKDTTCTPDN